MWKVQWMMLHDRSLHNWDRMHMHSAMTLWEECMHYNMHSMRSSKRIQDLKEL